MLFRINCFELASILCGNCISNIFENDKNNFEKNSFKFISSMNVESTYKEVKDFFINSPSDFSNIDRNKILISVKMTHSQMFFQVYKLNNKKFIYAFTHLNGIITEFHKIMKGLFEKNKSVFILF
jgi:hypothetical protein